MRRVLFALLLLLFTGTAEASVVTWEANGRQDSQERNAVVSWEANGRRPHRARAAVVSWEANGRQQSQERSAVVSWEANGRYVGGTSATAPVGRIPFDLLFHPLEALRSLFGID